MAFDFPGSPTVDQIYTNGEATFRWNGYGWVCLGTTDWDIGDASDVIVAPPVAGGDNVQDALEGLADADIVLTASINGKVSRAGDTMLGILTLSGSPINPLDAVTKAYVDSGGLADAYTRAQSDSRFVNVTGDTLTGLLNTAGLVNTGTFSNSGAMTIGGPITGALSAQFGTLSVTSTTNFTGLVSMQGGFNVIGNSSVYGKFQVTRNIMSVNPAGATNTLPSIGCYSVDRNTNLGFWNHSSGGYIGFGSLDGEGVLINTYALMNSVDLFLYCPSIKVPRAYYFQDANWGFTFNPADGSTAILKGGVTWTNWRASDGSFIHYYGQAFKPGGGVWSDTSDARIKDVIGDYQSGLDAIRKLRPVRFTFKGNDTHEMPQGKPLNHSEIPASRKPDDSSPPLDDGEPERDSPAVPYWNSGHRDAAIKKTPYVGLVAQEVEAVMPELVTKATGFIDGEAITDLRNIDTTPLIFALINAVKELSDKVAALEARG